MKLLPLISLLLISLTMNPPENGWVLKKNEDGIKVYVRDKEGSKLKELKITTTYTSTLSGIVSLLADRGNYKNWVYACADSYILKYVNDAETYHYQVTDAPWPVEDRDVIIHTTTKQDPLTKTVEIHAVGAPDYIAKKEDKVRVQDFQADWKIVPKEGGKVDVEYFISVDPAGNLPTWITNMAVTEGPLKTMQTIKKMLPDYQKKKLTYIKD